jgi:hypothetical protein
MAAPDTIITTSMREALNADGVTVSSNVAIPCHAMSMIQSLASTVNAFWAASSD